MSSAPMFDRPQFLPRDRFAGLFAALGDRGYQIIGPKVRQDAIVYDHVSSPDELPRGWTDRQEAGTYRLERRADDRYFGYTVGPHSWKQFLFPPSTTVSVARRTDSGWSVEANAGDQEPAFAFLGMRACELAAVAVQDRVFLQKDYCDPVYKARRERAFFVAVNCTQSAPTCFCVSMKTGPRCSTGFDLALTELDAGFIVEVAGDRGADVAAALALRPATDAELESADAERRRAAEQQSRTMPADDVRDLLMNNLQHPRWSQVAERCLSCTNCTMVCPTCFCSSVQEVTDLDAANVERRRSWDSCFNFDFSYMNGGIVRNSIRSRYRQWLTHKLATWHDQFETSGCVGCGRCITWCPVGIDLTAEVAAIRGETA